MFCRVTQDAYDTNKMAEKFTNDFYDQAFTVGQPVSFTTTLHSNGENLLKLHRNFQYPKVKIMKVIYEILSTYFAVNCV